MAGSYDRPVPYRTYDHRLKRAVAESGDPGLFPELNIPRSTARGWIRHGVPDVVTTEDMDLDTQALLLRNRELQRERDCAISTQELASFAFKLFGLQIVRVTCHFASVDRRRVLDVRAGKWLVPHIL